MNKKTQPIRILIAEDLSSDVELAVREIKKENIDFIYRVVDTESDFRKELSDFNPDLVISDYSMPAFDGMSALKITRSLPLNIPFIVLTGSMNEETAVACMKSGANDYVIKEQITRLPFAVLEAIEKRKTSDEKEKFQKELLESEAKYRSLIENSNDAIYLLYERKFEIINHRFEQMFGYTLEEVNRPDFDFISLVAPESRPFIEGRQQKIATGGKVDDLYEFTAIDKNGEKIEVEASVSYIDYKQGKAIQGIIRDVSERKKMIAELIKAKEKAEENDKLKTAFLHNISHEIRTPMNAIVGFAEFLSNPALTPEKRNHYTEIIVQSSNQLLSIITDIISIATVEAGQVNIQESDVNINEVCKLIYEQFANKARAGNISLEFTSTITGEEVRVTTDATKLHQVISNILGNAIKFTHEGGVNFGYRLKDNDVEFFVEDTGIGIPKDMHREIFKRFRQGDISTSKLYGGSGLGLSIAKAYVELLGGRIWLDSEPGRGSRFFFTIPDRKKAVPVPVRELVKEPGTNFEKTKTILVAEDEDLNYILLKEFLKDLNVTVCRAANGLEAVNICKADKRIDLILMDIKMPVMNGHEATRKIREFNPGLPIIAQTAYTSEQDKNNAFQSGCNDFISKPFKREDLIIKVNSHLGTDRQLS